MTYIKWGAILVALGAVIAFFHHYLPSQDIVRVVQTETVRVDVEETGPDGNPVTRTRDQNRIYTFTPDGEERVYRNEDTGWGFPWYFKFDTANLAAAAEDAVSSRDAPQWVVMTHYGWRITWWNGGVFPNAISMRPASGPDQTLIPWFNIIILLVLGVVVLAIRRVLIILRRQHVDPVVDALDDELDQTAGWWRRQYRKFFN